MKRSLRVALFLVVITGLVVGHHFWREARRERLFDRDIMAAAARHRVDPALVKAVVWRESRFDEFARGGKGELGLMQMMPATAQDWVKAEKIALFFPRRLFDPATSTRAGTWYLRKLLDRYRHTDRPAVYALADYNAGRVNVLRWAKGAAATNSAAFLRGMTFPGTRDYVTAVLARRDHYASTMPLTPRR